MLSFQTPAHGRVAILIFFSDAMYSYLMGAAIITGRPVTRKYLILFLTCITAKWSTPKMSTVYMGHFGSRHCTIDVSGIDIVSEPASKWVSKHFIYNGWQHLAHNYNNFSNVRIFRILTVDVSATLWAPSSKIVSLSISSWQILTAHAQPFRGTRDLAFCPRDSLLVWATSRGSG